VDAADACVGYSVIEYGSFFTVERVAANPRVFTVERVAANPRVFTVERVAANPRAKEWMRLRRAE